MVPREKIIGILKRELPELKKTFGVKRLALFGSFAKRTQKKESDIDILVEFNKPLGFEFVDFAEYLERALGRKTDILTPDGIKGIRIKGIAQDITKSLRYV